jgi:4-diphosphocytidyl-2-C-methyl-D-erythritol kinase
VILRPPAKINLMLRVGASRPDGYHDVRTLLQSVAVSDTLTVTPRRGPFVLRTRALGVPVDRENLVWRAAALLWEALEREGDPRDAHVKLEKQIPVAAGLGGGSADAAAALVGLNRVWGARWPTRELARLAARLGADVPFFLQGGTALGVGRGDELYPVEDIARFGVVILKPTFGVTTAEAYRWLDEDRAAGVIDVPPREPGVEVGWTGGPVAFVNDLEAPVARRHPDVARMVEACRRAGALGAAMTGSGSAVFGVFPPASVRTAARRLKRPGWVVVATTTLTRREAARGMGIV